jgi:hypothetical protein
VVDGTAFYLPRWTAETSIVVLAAHDPLILSLFPYKYQPGDFDLTTHKLQYLQAETIPLYIYTYIYIGRPPHNLVPVIMFSIIRSPQGANYGPLDEL